MSDDIIDLDEYRARRFEAEEDDEDGGAFSLHGADGERSRFALPLWRTIYLAGADRGALVWVPDDGSGPPEPLTVLDLKEEPARTEIDPRYVAASGDREGMRLHESAEGWLCVFLGRHEGRRWYMVVDGGSGGALDAKTREDILFMAGECAGLLFERGLSSNE